MLLSFAGKKPPKPQPFVLPNRNFFDFVATRDINPLEGSIQGIPTDVMNERDATRSGYSALHVACDHGHVDIVRALLGQPAPPIDDSVMLVITAATTTTSPGKRGKPRGESIHRNKSPNPVASTAPPSREAGATNGKRLEERKFTAAEKREAAASAAMLDVNALPVPLKLPTTVCCPVNATSDQGLTPLHVATMRGHTSIVKILLENGADPLLSTTVAGAPMTAYQLARHYRFPDIEYILEPLTIPTASMKTVGGEEDAAAVYLREIDPLRAAQEGNIMYFSLALLDYNTDAVVNEKKYEIGCQFLQKIRTAVDEATGDNVLMTALNHPDACIDNAIHGIIDLLLLPVTYHLSPGKKHSECMEAVFVAGSKKGRIPTKKEYDEGIVDLVVAEAFEDETQRRKAEAKRKRLEARRRQQRRKSKGPGEDVDEDYEEEADAEAAEDLRMQAAAVASTPDPKSVAAAYDHSGQEAEATTPQEHDDVPPWNINARNAQSLDTALHIAVRKSHLPFVQRLLDLAADINATNKDGETPYSLAIDAYPDSAIAADTEATNNNNTEAEGDTNNVTSTPQQDNSTTTSIPPSAVNPAAAIRALLEAAAARKAFMDVYVTRNDVHPDDRPQFMEDAKALKKKWREMEERLEVYRLSSD